MAESERRRAQKAAYWQRPDVKARERERGRQRYAENAERCRAWSRAWKAANPERQKHHNRVKRFRAYGMDEAQFEALFASQGKRCRICPATKPSGKGWHIDHCHTTGKIRGILCQHCNLMLGHARDDPALLIAAATYLQERPR